MLADLIARLEALDKAATPGPWVFDPENVGMSFDGGYGLHSGVHEGSFLAGHEVAHIACSTRAHNRLGAGVPEVNAQLIAALRNELPRMLRLLRAGGALSEWLAMDVKDGEQLPGLESWLELRRAALREWDEAARG